MRDYSNERAFEEHVKTEVYKELFEKEKANNITLMIENNKLREQIKKYEQEIMNLMEENRELLEELKLKG